LMPRFCYSPAAAGPGLQGIGIHGQTWERES